MTSQLIIGGGPAATNAIETIRQFDRECAIALVADEPPHSRMALPYWLSGQIPREQTFTGDTAYFEQLGVTTHFGRRARSLDRDAKVIGLDDGNSLPYDRLLLATGSRPLALPITGGDLSGVTPKWTLAHVEQGLNILDRIAKPRVVLVGAGFIGFIILSALHKRGCQLTVVERESHVLPKMLSPASSQYVDRWLARKNVAVQTNTSVTAIAAAEDGTKTVTTTAGTIEADLVVVAIGVQPNLELAAASGLDTDHGILVDRQLRTSDPAIFAAGDCAQGPALFSSETQVHAIHPTAVDHGRIAGANMVGQNIDYAGSLSMNVLDVCGLQCVSYGNWHDPSAEAMEIASPDTSIYRNLLWTGDQITGAMFVGEASNVGMLTDVGMIKGLMQSQTSLGPWKAFLQKNPFDVRRAYIGSGVAAKLAKTTLLGRPATARGFHFGGQRPAAEVKPHHAAYVGTKPE